VTQTVNIGSAIARPPTVYTPGAALSGFNAFHTALYDTDLENVFFGATEFAETAMIYHSGPGTWEAYSVLFDDPTVKVKGTGDAEVLDLQPSFTVPEVQLLSPIRPADRVQVRGVTYFVDTAETDGFGVVTVMLKLKDR